MMGFRVAQPIVAIGIMVMSPVSAAPQEVAQNCDTEAALPAEFADWSKRSRAEAEADIAKVNAADMEIGRAITAALKPAAKLRYAAQPGKAGTLESFGGMFALTISKPGIYRIALGSGSWIDVVRNGKAVASSSHGHGPACSGIRKIVDFQLQPGRYVLQIAGASVAELPIMVIAEP